MAGQIQGKGRSGRRRGHAMMSEINVTPFVDVMLVLLVIFMVTAPLVTAGVQLDLPKVQAKSVSAPDNAPLEVAIDTAGRVHFGDTLIKPDELASKLAAIYAEAPERRVYIRADKGLDYGRVMGLMSTINNAGFTKIALLTDPAKAKTK